MPKILLRVADEQLRSDIEAALAKTKFAVVVADPITAADSPKEITKQLLESKAAAVILDYIQDDAASVKLLQSTTDSARIPHFIFIMPKDIDLSHVLMAVNEGASAMIEQPVKMPALVNYVERAINGPGRLRINYKKNESSEDEVGELEKRIRILRQYNSALQKLVAYLLSTPLSEQKRKALIVSDSTYQRDILSKMLEEHLFSVLTATNAKDGLDVALAEKPLIVVSDLEMEGQNGIEFCRTLKIEHKFIPCHFIICTANSEKYDVVMAPGNGVDDCVIKPDNESGYKEFIARVALGLTLGSGGDDPGVMRRMTRVFTKD